MARETRKKKTKLPASSAHRTEPVLKLRLERKEHPSDPEAIPFRTPQERIAATRLSLSFWDQYLKRMETGFAGIHSRFAAFERGRNLSTILRHWALAFTVQPSPASSLS